MLCRRKRRQRVQELRRHIQMITDPFGCSWALSLFRECSHLHEHYMIPLREAGFEGTIQDLLAEADKSLKRHDARKAEVLRVAAVYV